jgi:pyridoxine 5-phosphate synthase
MSRLAIDVDAVAIIRNVFLANVPDPAHMVVLAELGGAESIVCHLRDDMRSVNERDVRIIRELVKTHLNVRCSSNTEHIQRLLRIKPDMITFVANSDKTPLESKPLDLISMPDSLGNVVADLRANDIATSVLIAPDITQVKMAAKLEFDYIEVYANNYTIADDLDQQLAELENINSMAIAANRLGMGVNASGNLNQENISDMAKIQFIDDLIVGNAILVKALGIGFEQAIRDFISIL